jgi:hypothetical protein
MRTVYVIPHCHWDREWYQPHELFRWRLVQMIDELLDHMETHPEYPCFTLDGQTVVIEDYLELRPENEPRLRALIESGRIVIGPWWVQPDEFLPSGESHIRSLQRGIRFADRLGGSLRVGHCADQFGHIAQMPQLMRQLGLTSACLWRGVPDAIPGWSFQWEAPDGTRLPVLYLRNSYSSGWRLPAEPDDLLERVRRQERDRRDDEPLVLMNGTDHSRMEKHVPAALAAAADRGYDFRLVTLGEYERAQFAAGIDEVVHHGELRSPDRSNVLVGVLSARANIKQREFEVSSALERYAEPLELLAHLHGGPDASPALRHAWRLLLENSPHDSICGCSVDQTHREMFPRYDRAEQLAHVVARESLGHVVQRLAVPGGGGIALFRPVPHAEALLECTVPGTWTATSIRLPGGTIVPCALGPVEPEVELVREDVSPQGARRHLDFIREGRYDNHAVEDMGWELAGRHLRVTTTVGDDLNVVDDDSVRREVREVAVNGLADTAEVRVVRSARRILRAVLPPSATIGVELLTPAGSAPPRTLPTATADTIVNEHYRVRFRNGRLTIRDLRAGREIAGANTFISEGERGDEYNADSLADAVMRPARAELVEVSADAVSATLRYRLELSVPAALDRQRTRRTRGTRVTLPILTTVTLWAGLPRIDFRVTVENNARDHRLRVHFSLPFETGVAITENQFHVAERSLTPPLWNGISNEKPPTTFPQKRFAAFEADSDGMAVFNKGLQEGEVVVDGRGRQAYAVTLLRCVGWLSRPDLQSRRGGAGPTIATEDSQMQGRHTFDYALTTYRGDWRSAGIQPMAHSFAHPPLAFATNEHEGSLEGSAPLVSIDSPSAIPSALARSEVDGAPLVRLYNAGVAPIESTVRLPAASGVPRRVDLLERPLDGPPGEAAGALRPWEIATLRFEG